MSKDKLKSTLAIVPEFANGEIPAPQKLNASFSSVDQALERVEEAVGDIYRTYNNSVSLSKKKNIINSLGRYLGSIQSVDIPADLYENFNFSFLMNNLTNEWVLPVYPYEYSSTAILPEVPSVVLGIDASGCVDYDGNTVFSTQVGESVDLTEPGQWKFTRKSNKITSYSVPQEGTAYATGISFLGAEKTKSGLPGFQFGQADASPMFYPNLNIGTATSLEIAASTDTSYKYVLTLHPEQFKLKSPQIRNINSTNLNDNVDGTNLNLSFAELFETQDLGIAPLIESTSYLNQKLPFYIRSSYSAGEQVPKPYLLLYDEQADTILSGVDFYYKNETSLYLKGKTLSTDSSYRLVGMGQSISDVVEGNTFDLRHHKHKGPSAISHEDLLGVHYKPSSVLELPGSLISQNPSFARPSIQSFAGNPHPQYLSRYGYFYGEDIGNLSNAMMGPLVFSHATGTIGDSTSGALDVVDTGAATYGLYFSGLNGAAIRCLNDSTDHLYMALSGGTSYRPILQISDTSNFSFNSDGVNHIAGRVIPTASNITVAFAKGTGASDSESPGGHLLDLAGHNLSLNYEYLSAAGYHEPARRTKALMLGTGSTSILSRGSRNLLLESVGNSQDVSVGAFSSKVDLIGDGVGVEIVDAVNSYVEIIGTSDAGTITDIEEGEKRIIADKIYLKGERKNSTQSSYLTVSDFELYSNVTFIPHYAQSTDTIVKFHRRSTGGGANRDYIVFGTSDYDAVATLSLPKDSILDRVNISCEVSDNTGDALRMYIYALNKNGITSQLQSQILYDPTASETSFYSHHLHHFPLYHLETSVEIGTAFDIGVSGQYYTNASTDRRAYQIAFRHQGTGHTVLNNVSFEFTQFSW